MKRTRKIIAAVIAAITAVTSITACSADYSHIDGYSDVENAKKIIKRGIIIGGSIAAVLLIVVIVLIFSFVY